jgi:hypothetical protein
MTAQILPYSRKISNSKGQNVLIMEKINNKLAQMKKSKKYIVFNLIFNII